MPDNEFEEEIIEGAEEGIEGQTVIEEVNAVVATAMEAITEEMTIEEALETLVQAITEAQAPKDSALGGLGDGGEFPLPEEEEV